MFTPDDRDAVRTQLLERARRDARITGAALTGSAARGEEDRWSDVDVFLGVEEGSPVDEVVADWTRGVYEEHGAVHHWDVRSGPAVYRVFLLANCLHVDIAFAPESAFGARGPSFRAVFGEPVETAPAEPPSFDGIAGLGWLAVQHASVAVERRKLWQAEHWVSAVRDQTLALACLRLGEPTAYARGADLLPPELTAPLEDSLVRSLDTDELRRALRSATDRFIHELRQADAAVADALTPPLLELAGG